MLNQQMAISDPSGKALALVEEDSATLLIKWNGEQCKASYSLPERNKSCLLYTSDAADEGLGVDLGGRRIIIQMLMCNCLLYTSPSPRD